MNTIFRATQTIGEIVAIMPKSSEVFKQYKIDFCCGGNRQLSEAVREQKLDEREVLKKLDEVFEENSKVREGNRDFREMSRSQLIEHILNMHHAYLKKILPELSEMTTKIMRVHGVNHEVLFRIHKLFSTLKAELEQHLIKEEDVLFPLIKEHEREPSIRNLKRITKVLKETEDEHEAAGDILKELRNISGDYIVPEDGCNTYILTFKMLEELEADLFQHIHLENNILFKNIGFNEN